MFKLTLEEIKGEPLDKPNLGSSLSKTIHDLYKTKPVGTFDAGDLRIFIGQKMFLDELIPLALNVLNENPWIEGTYFEGDLLAVVIEMPGSFWNERASLKSQLSIIVDKALLKVIDHSYVNKLEKLKSELASGYEGIG